MVVVLKKSKREIMGDLITRFKSYPLSDLLIYIHHLEKQNRDMDLMLTRAYHYTVDHPKVDIRDAHEYLYDCMQINEEPCIDSIIEKWKGKK